MLVRAVHGLEGTITGRHGEILARLLSGWGSPASTVTRPSSSPGSCTATPSNGPPDAPAHRAACLGGLDRARLRPAARAPVLVRALPALGLALALVGCLVAVGAYATIAWCCWSPSPTTSCPPPPSPTGSGSGAVATFAGSVGMFLVLLLLFLRALPVVSITDLRAQARGASPPRRPKARSKGPIQGPAPAEAPEMTRRSGASARSSTIRAIWPPPCARSPAGTPITGRPCVSMPTAPCRCRTPWRLSPAGTARSGPTTLGAALAGGAAFYGMCVLRHGPTATSSMSAGAPPFSWPSFVVPSVSFAMLSGTLAVHAVFLFVNRLPRLNHPAFNIEGFERATQGRYFLAAEARGPGFDRTASNAGSPPCPRVPDARSPSGGCRDEALPALALVLSLAGCGEANMRDQPGPGPGTRTVLPPGHDHARARARHRAPRRPGPIRPPPRADRRGPAGAGPGALTASPARPVTAAAATAGA